MVRFERVPQAEEKTEDAAAAQAQGHVEAHGLVIIDYHLSCNGVGAPQAAAG
jgi:hypothetical protein